jgi:hypothetical protein
MIRPPLSRITPDTAKASVKERKRKCKHCSTLFLTFSSFVSWCSPDCGAEIALRKLEEKAAQARKESRMQDRKRKEEMMPIKQHLKLTEKVMNRYVRLRDYYEGCCSCDKPSHWDGQWHASHFKSVGSNSLLRFHLWNIHKGCSECNRHKSGNVGEYTERLMLKYGPERVQWLEDRKNGSKEYTAEYLIRMRKIFTKKCKRLEKRLGL